VIGVILTGANDDGARGLAKIKDRGGIAIVQDPNTAEARTMPEAAIAATRVDVIASLREIGEFLKGAGSR
jgi:two-component system chemotaxis response regulator CheB